MNDYTTRREFTRVPIHIWGTFHEGGREIVTAEITMLSLRGCYAAATPPLPAGGRYRLELYTGEASATIHIMVEARIVRTEEAGMGVEFVEMPLESYDHLRNMVLLNASDPEQVERELRAHIGLKRAS
jgi:hypothetical protein